MGIEDPRKTVRIIEDLSLGTVDGEVGIAIRDPQKVALAGLVTNEILRGKKMTPSTLICL